MRLSRSSLDVILFLAGLRQNVARIDYGTHAGSFCTGVCLGVMSVSARCVRARDVMSVSACSVRARVAMSVSACSVRARGVMSVSARVVPAHDVMSVSARGVPSRDTRRKSTIRNRKIC